MSSSNTITPRHLALISASGSSQVVSNKISKPTKSELVQEFLEIAFRIARKQDYSHRDPLKDYLKRHSVHIKEEKDFIPDLIRTLQQHIAFEPVGDGTLGVDRVVKTGLDITGTMCLFIAVECWVLILQIQINRDMVAQMLCLKMHSKREIKDISDDDLRDFIVTFRNYERPWILLAAITVAAERNLFVKYVF